MLDTGRLAEDHSARHRCRRLVRGRGRGSGHVLLLADLQGLELLVRRQRGARPVCLEHGAQRLAQRATVHAPSLGTTGLRPADLVQQLDEVGAVAVVHQQLLGQRSDAAVAVAQQLVELVTAQHVSQPLAELGQRFVRRQLLVVTCGVRQR